jgi:hypothetical protein
MRNVVCVGVLCVRRVENVFWWGVLVKKRSQMGGKPFQFMEFRSWGHFG